MLIPALLFLNAAYYTIFSYMRKGIFYKSIGLKYSDTLYVPILIVVFILWFIGRKKDSTLTESNFTSESWKRWLLIVTGLIVVIIIITLISINIHEGTIRSHERS